jgi:hypothetical protein
MVLVRGRVRVRIRVLQMIGLINNVGWLSTRNGSGDRGRVTVRVSTVQIGSNNVG